MHLAVSMIAVLVCVALAAKAWVAMGRELRVMAAEDAWYLEQTRLMREARRQMTDDEWAAFDEWRASLEVAS